MKPFFKIISFLIVVAFTLTTVLPPSFAQDIRSADKISLASRFEATTERVSPWGTSPAIA